MYISLRVAISVNNSARVTGDSEWKMSENQWLHTQAALILHSSGQYNVYTHYSRFVFPLIAGIKRRLRIVMLRVFSRFRRLANARHTVGCYRVRISVQATRRERSLFTASPSNFPDDKSLWNSSKARPIRRGRWRDGAKGTFRAFTDVREPLGETIPRPPLSSWRLPWMCVRGLLFSFTASDSRLLDSTGPIFPQQRFIALTNKLKYYIHINRDNLNIF